MKNIFTFVLIFLFSIVYADDIKIINKEIMDSSVLHKYFVSANYPKLINMKDNKVQKNINNKIFDVANKNLSEFRFELDDWDEFNYEPEYYSYMHINYDTYMLNEEIFSFSFDISTYYTGAMHPNRYTVSMTFDMKNGKLISLKDLFKLEVNYIKKISEYCVADFLLQGNIAKNYFFENELNEGAGPKDSNFVNFNLMQKGMLITFDPCQVTGYVMGTQYVIIPYKAIYGFFKEDCILNKIDY